MKHALRFAGVAARWHCWRWRLAPLSGKPAPGPEVPRPDSVLDPGVLYSQNCAGCHGAEGKQGTGDGFVRSGLSGDR